MIRVLIVDDQELLRDGLSVILDAQDDIEVAGQAADGREAIARARETMPDVVLMDVRMPVMDGIEATRQLRAAGFERLGILMLTTFDLDEYVYEALRAGANGFLLKDVPRAIVVEGVRTVAAGESLLAPAITRRLIERYASGPPDRSALPPQLELLSPRERDTLARLARGRSNAEIAGRARAQRGDGEDARRRGAAQARPARPHPGGRLGVRVGARPARRARSFVAARRRAAARIVVPLLQPGEPCESLFGGQTLKTFSANVFSIRRGSFTMITTRQAARAVAALSLLLLVPAAIGASGSSAAQPGTLASASFHSTTLGEDIAYNVYLPAGYESTAKQYPVLYLLHGRGDSMSAWTQVKGRLDQLIADGAIPPTIAIMPDAPWSQRASYYVDSQYKGSDRAGTNRGRGVETAFTQDLIQHVDSTYRTLASRDGRVVGGYSMGGYGAIRFSLAHPDLFVSSIVLSPAVYIPKPPDDSSTREFGAFGRGRDLFSTPIYKSLNYPEELGRFHATGLKSHMFVAVGDDEYQNPGSYEHDLDFESMQLYKTVEREPNMTSELRVLNGGHDWEVWGPAFEEGVKYAFQFVARPEVSIMKATLTGTPGEDREGGVAVDASGNVYEALAAMGSIDGQTNAGDKDVVLIKVGPTGTKLWTKEFGTGGTDRAYGLAARPGRPPGRRRLHEGQPRRRARRQHQRRRLRRQVRPQREP